MDVDGVLTDAGMYYTEHGDERVGVAATRQDGNGMYDALNACVECLIAHADAEVLPPSFGFFARDFSVVAGRLGRTPEAVGTLERLRAAYPRDTVLPQVLAAARAPLSPPLR